MKFTLFLLAPLLYSNVALGANHILLLRKNHVAAQAGVAAANLTIGCIKGGIGTRKISFWTGCWKGTLGGAVSFIGEYTASYVGGAYWAGGLGKIIHSAGVSIQDNVAENISIFSRYQIELGPATLTWHKSKLPKVSYSLVSVLGLGIAIGYNAKFDLGLSLKTLTPVFFTQEQMKNNFNGWFKGFCIGNSVLVSLADKEQAQFINRDRVHIAHEINHAISWANFRLAGNKIRFGNWEIGRDLLYSSFALFYLNDSGAQFYHPLEIQAYSMQQNSYYREGEEK